MNVHIDMPEQLHDFYSDLSHNSNRHGGKYVSMDTLINGVLEHYARKHGYEPSAYKAESRIYRKYADMRRATNERLKREQNPG